MDGIEPGAPLGRPVFCAALGAQLVPVIRRARPAVQPRGRQRSKRGRPSNGERAGRRGAGAQDMQAIDRLAGAQTSINIYRLAGAQTYRPAGRLAGAQTGALESRGLDV
jgi:hypothetical protein